MAIDALSKVLDIGAYQAVLALSGIVPGVVVPFLAWTVLVSEGVLGMCLVSSPRLPPALRGRALWGTAAFLVACLSFDISRVCFGCAIPGPYFGVWSALHPAAEAAVAALLLIFVVFSLGQPAASGSGQPDSAASKLANT